MAMFNGDPMWLARNTPALGLCDHSVQIDMAALRAWRLERVRDELRRRDYGACLLYDPINIRYATGSRNMTVWTLHNAARYCFIPTEGPIILFDFHGCGHLSEGLETIAEVRPTTSWYYFGAGPRMAERAVKWAIEIADLVHTYGGGNRRLAMDHCDPLGFAALSKEAIEVHDAQGPLEMARAIKSPMEVALMGAAVAVAEAGISAMREALKPGMTENALWALLHEANIRLGGEWIETRLLASGGRTNPWFQECSDRIIRAGELVAFDTDLIGPFGYCADISRAFFCGPGRPSDEQRALYGLALEQIHYNMELLKPGLGFRELAEKAWRIPNAYWGNRYSVVVHGVGMADEYPHVGHLDEFTSGMGYDGVFEANMAVCVESYIGAEGGAEGVKLEQQVLITENGVQLLSPYPFEEELME
ncbi:MAG TPA: Xaa-Pro peptidase family protein [Alphaproteobacteria bacterium]|nr:Xaa-Pro peptidase family protein [Alphaproteobacteria bacterium]